MLIRGCPRFERGLESPTGAREQTRKFQDLNLLTPRAGLLTSGSIAIALEMVLFLGELEFSWPTGRLEINIDILLKRSILDFGGKNGHPLLRMHRSQTAIATRKPVGAILSSVHGGIIHFHRFGMDTFFGLEKCRPLRHFEGTGSQRCGAQHGSAQLKFIVSLNR